MTLAFPLRLSLVGALLGLHLAAQAAPAAPVTASFDTTPRAGQHQRQLIDLQAVMKARMEAGPDATDAQRAKLAQAAEGMERMGPMKMKMRMEQTLKVDAPDAEGWLPMTVAVGAKGGSMEFGGKVNPLPNLSKTDMRFAARFNPRDFSFEMQKFEGGSAEMSEMMRTQGNAAVAESLQLFKALSQREMKIGESVEVPLNMSLPMPLPGGANAMQAKVRYTLARVDKGVAHFDLDMDLKMEVNTPLPQPAAAAAASAAAGGEADAPPQMLNMVIAGGGKGTSSLRLADRLPLASRLTMDMKMTMNGPDNGRMFMDMDMVVQSKGESVTKAAAAKKKS